MDKKPLRRELDFVGVIEDMIPFPPNERQTTWFDEYQVYDVSAQYSEEQFEKELDSSLALLGVTREQLNAGRYQTLADCRAAVEAFLSDCRTALETFLKNRQGSVLNSALVQEDSLLR